MTAPTAYPLAWPEGRPRTERPTRARFDVSFARARDELCTELQRLGARLPVLSTNVELRLDGLPYAGRPEPKDTGVAVYFQYADRQMCFACDRWDRVQDNIRAIERTINAMRGIERWGTGEMMKRAFSAFEALPNPARQDWRATLGLRPDADLSDAEAAYRQGVKQFHPDRPTGDAEQFHKINQAIEQARKELS